MLASGVIYAERNKTEQRQLVEQQADFIKNANHVDIYDNSNPVPNSVGLPSDVDIWNNIFNLSNTVGAENRILVSLGLIDMGTTTSVSGYNLFWHTSDSAAGNTHFAILANGVLTAKNLSQWRTSRDSTFRFRGELSVGLWSAR